MQMITGTGRGSLILRLPVSVDLEMVLERNFSSCHSDSHYLIHCIANRITAQLCMKDK